MRYIRQHLAAKLFLSYMLIIVVIVIITAIFLNFATPNALVRHMGPAGQSMGEMMRPGQGQPELVGRFQAAVYDAFSMAILAAFVAALIISIWISRLLAAPVYEISRASKRIADGHYSERVTTGMNSGESELDEISSMGLHFNQMAESLEQTETMRRQLLADVSHELRTPLTSIRGTAEGLMDGVIPANIETFQTVLHETERMQRLVEDIHELSRVEAGQYQLQKSQFEISELLHKVEKRFERQFKEKQVSLKVQNTGSGTMYADITRIDQVLQNLVGNALKYSQSGGNVEIQITRKDNETIFTVKDDGRGIELQDLKRIFTRFYRVDESRSRDSGGSGIGLTIAKHWVEAHNGTIWAESSGVGKGSSFYFEIPNGK